MRGSMLGLTLVQELAALIYSCQYNDIRENAIKQVQLSILDSLGCALAGASEIFPATEILAEYVRQIGGRAESSLFVYGTKVPIQNAVLFNSTMTRVPELDDEGTGAPTGIHSGVVTVPVALAMGEREKSKGYELLTAVTLGYEVLYRIGRLVKMEGMQRGFTPSNLLGAFGAATVAGKLLHLNEDELSNMLGICCLSPLSPTETSRGGTVKDIQAGGWPSLVGVSAALLAKMGITGPKRLIEGDMGLCKCVAGKHPLLKEDVEAFLSGLGSDWAVERIQRKIHACCGLTFSTLDATLDIMNKTGIKINDVERVEITTQTMIYQFTSNSEIRDAVSARFSIPFLVGLVLKDGKPVNPHMIFERLKDQEILNFMQNVHIRVDKDLDKLWPFPTGYLTSIVEITTKGGSKFRNRRDLPRGHPRTPLTTEEVIEKFRNLASAVASPHSVKRIINVVNTLEKLEDTSDLVRLLTFTNK